MSIKEEVATVLSNLLRNPLLAVKAIRALRKSGRSRMKHVLLKGTKNQHLVATLLDNGRQRRSMLLPNPLLHEATQQRFSHEIASQPARVFAYYHPAFHQTEFNDKAWGEGFTEWTSVLSGSSRFDGHYQPRIPLNYNFYDQSDESTVKWQIDLASDAGITGMIFYSYFSDGEVRFKEPLTHFRNAGRMPWLSMWCNQNWTKKWDSSENELLWRQTYESDQLMVDYFAEQFSDPMYEKISGRPLFIVYLARQIPGGASQVAKWRALFKSRHQCNPVILAAQYGSITLAEALALGFDGLAGHSEWARRKKQLPVAVKRYSNISSDEYVSYEKYGIKYLERSRDPSREISSAQPD